MPPSPQEYLVTGLNLLRLLVGRHVSDSQPITSAAPSMSMMVTQSRQRLTLRQ